MTAAISISALGPLRVWRDGVPQAVGSPQQQALLVALLIRDGRAASMDDLVAAVWGDDLPDTAVATARTYIYRLRRLFDGTVVSIDTLGRGYALSTGRATVDVTAFQAGVAEAHERMRAGDAPGAAELVSGALALWEGEALAGVPGRAAERARVRLEDTRVAAEELLFTARLETSGASAEELARLTELVETYPLREGFRALLMLALYRRGRQAEALELYQRGRALLRDELALDPGPALRDMQRRILRSDPALLAAEAGTGPTYLPADLPDFTGRVAELAVITGALVPGATVGITALPGFGRTSTAVHVAHLLAGEFPDGRLYADLAAPDSLAETLLTWSRLFGVAGALPATVTGRATLLRTAAAGRRPLIVLDDVEDPADVAVVRSALPHAALLLTSRRRHHRLAGTAWVTLGGLADDESMRLFEHIAGAARVASDPGWVRDAIAAIDGAPLSVRLAAERVARRPHRTVRSLVEELTSELHDPYAPLHDDCVIAEAPMVRAYRLLRPQAARTLRFLTATDACAATVPEVAAMLCTTENNALTALDSLVDLHLVADGADGRYRITDPMVQAVARRMLHEIDGRDEIEAAVRRAFTPSRV
ncbi:AfsR/SARP family transcriptional regulator [Catenuloplanes atrovinosus]|uniref:DNA-binding SARP family transcriptional activator n=1 Tax=Catenuloplanes atrovinosus TaxID=137266 RepID=A0AAE3YKW5_9ACTN|nr:BTAD domain-containing putative transcriptional regulator [Catenuloplanes atrovinosus]MDR7275689.1 DNA-binding SARP family transcriptional activator [Catenuloplanes atrovinosus]